MVGSLGFAVFVKDFAGDVAGVVGAAAQAVLVFGGAFEVMGEGRNFEGDLCGVVAGHWDGFGRQGGCKKEGSGGQRSRLKR